MNVTTTNLYDLSLMKSVAGVTVTFNDIKGYGDSFKLGKEYPVEKITPTEIVVRDEEGDTGDLRHKCFNDFVINIPNELLDTSAAHEAELAKLQEMQKLFAQNETFAVGDLITWKTPEMRFNTFPALGQPAIVTEIVESPVFNDIKDTNRSSALKHDIIAGVMIDNCWVTFPYDSRLFKKI
jgi:hypothetical protein